eukprot:3872866-Pleurochrysis_carterae.AAC.2
MNGTDLESACCDVVALYIPRMLRSSRARGRNGFVLSRESPRHAGNQPRAHSFCGHKDVQFMCKLQRKAYEGRHCCVSCGYFPKPSSNAARLLVRPCWPLPIPSCSPSQSMCVKVERSDKIFLAHHAMLLLNCNSYRSF